MKGAFKKPPPPGPPNEDDGQDGEMVIQTEVSPEEMARLSQEARGSSQRDRKTPKLLRTRTGFKSRHLLDGNSRAGRILQDPNFENLVLSVIVMNAVWLGVDLDWNNPESKIPSIFFIVGENLFCIFFVFELGLRFAAYRKKCDFFTEKQMRTWNVFDLVLVGLMVLETWILPALPKNDSGGEGGGGGMRNLSTLRLLRLLRISRIFRMIPELGMMVKSMVAAARSVSSTFILAVGIMYVFAIILTQWAKSGDDNADEAVCEGEVCFMEIFGNIRISMLTLMQILVFDDTFAIVRPTFYVSISIGSVLILFMMVASFTVLNMLIGVICDIVSMTTAFEKEKVLRLKVEDLFEQIDHDGSGIMSRTDFEMLNGIDLLEKLGIDRQLLENVWDIIHCDDPERIPASKFIDCIFKLLHPPESQDVMEIHKKVDRFTTNLALINTQYAVQNNLGSANPKKIRATLEIMREAEEVDDRPLVTKALLEQLGGLGNQLSVLEEKVEDYNQIDNSSLGGFPLEDMNTLSSELCGLVSNLRGLQSYLPKSRNNTLPVDGADDGDDEWRKAVAPPSRKVPSGFAWTGPLANGAGMDSDVKPLEDLVREGIARILAVVQLFPRGNDMIAQIPDEVPTPPVDRVVEASWSSNDAPHAVSDEEEVQNTLPAPPIGEPQYYETFFPTGDRQPFAMPAMPEQPWHPSPPSRMRAAAEKLPPPPPPPPPGWQNGSPNWPAQNGKYSHEAPYSPARNGYSNYSDFLSPPFEKVASEDGNAQLALRGPDQLLKYDPPPPPPPPLSPAERAEASAKKAAAVAAAAGGAEAAGSDAAAGAAVAAAAAQAQIAQMAGCEMPALTNGADTCILVEDAARAMAAAGAARAAMAGSARARAAAAADAASNAAARAASEARAAATNRSKRSL